MNQFGINTGMLLLQMGLLIVLTGLPVISLIDLGKKKLGGTPLAVWALIVCALPILGALAYWIIKPSAEKK